jgi:uracil phosphoribosyltransferase
LGKVEKSSLTNESSGHAQTLLEAGVLEENIVFLNVISCPEGIHTLFAAYPSAQ